MRSSPRGARRTVLSLAPVLALAACGNVEATPDGGAGPGPGPDGPATITFRNTIAADQTADGALVAFQDGDGAWQVLTGTGGVYTFQVASGRYGLMAVCERPGAPNVLAFNEVFVDYYAVSDASTHEIFADCNAVAAPRKTVNVTGTVAGLQTGDRLSISTDIGLDVSQNTSWSLPATEGPGHLLALRSINDRPVGILFNPVTYAEGKVFALDFAQQVFPTEVGLTPDPSAATASISASYLDPSGQSWRIDSPPPTANRYRMLPPDQIGDGIAVLTEQTSNAGASRMVEHAFKVPSAQTLTLPQTFQPASPPKSIATTPYPMYAVTLPQVAGLLSYNVSYLASPMQQDGSTALLTWHLMYSAAWLTASGHAGADFASAMPDLSGLAGWKASYAMPASGVSWTTIADTGPHRRLQHIVVPADQLPLRQDGDVVTTAQAGGTLP